MSRSALPPAMKDPLLSAVISKLPPAGCPWPLADREAWFVMMRNAVEVAYGATEQPKPAAFLKAVLLDPADEHVADLKMPPEIYVHRFVVAPDGTASDETGRLVDPSDIPSGSVIEDYRPQPVDNEYNPIMWKSLGSVKQPLPAGVVLRAARDAWRGRGAMNGEAQT